MADFIMNIFRILPAMLVVAMSANAQNVEKLHISDIKAGRDGSRFNVTMTISPCDFKLSLNREIEIVPVIWSSDSTEAIQLPAVIIAGKNMYYYNVRNDRPAQPNILYRAGKGEPVAYSQQIEYLPWMETATLGFIQRELGCCGAPKSEPETTPVARIDYRPRRFEPQFIYTRPQASGEKTVNLKGQAYIDFPVNRTEIYPDYRKNPQELLKILKSIDAVKGNPDAKVKQISLKGFASPEGPYQNNIRLAKGRTQALKDYVGRQYDFAPSVYSTSYEPEDWEGLRDSLEVSFLPERDAMLALIAENIEPDRKDALLKQRFPADYAYILKNIYPALRHTDYVITYTVRQYTDINEIRQVMETRPQDLSLEEFYLLAQSYPAGSKDFDEVFDIAVRMFPSDPVANLNAANAAMTSGQMERAEKYLSRAGSSAQADYARGLFLALRKDYDNSIAVLEKAAKAGLSEASHAIEAIQTVQSTQEPVTWLEQN